MRVPNRLQGNRIKVHENYWQGVDRVKGSGVGLASESPVPGGHAWLPLSRYSATSAG